MAKKTKRGRPCKVNWSKFNLQWKNKTNAEIAHEAGCTVANVSVRRKKLVAAAEAAGKNPDHYRFAGKRYTRSRYIESQPEVAAPVEQ
jgi:hypothetical protein